METFLIKRHGSCSGEELQLEAIHNPDFSDRKGYDPKFLGREVRLPVLSDKMPESSIAINWEPGKNGPAFLDYHHFSVMFNKDKKLPFFTAVNILGKTNELAKEHEARDGDSWFIDNRVKAGANHFQFDNGDYTNSGLQRGHMVRYYDPAWDKDEEKRKTAMGDTFHFTNCCPQLGKYNAGVWNDLEDYYMARAIFKDRKVSVFSGPVLKKAKRIGSLLVPVNFWKVIAYVKENKLEAIGFLISHEIAFEKLVQEKLLEEGKPVKPTLKPSDIDRLFTGRNLRKWVVKLELIEEKTGICFGLNDQDVNKREARFYNLSVDRVDKEWKKIGLPGEDSIDITNMDDTVFIRNI